MIYETKRTRILVIFPTLILLVLMLNISSVQTVNLHPSNDLENISVKERTVYVWNYSDNCKVRMTVEDVCTLDLGCGYQTVEVKVETDESGIWQEIPISCDGCEGLYFLYNHTNADLKFHNEEPSPTVMPLIIPTPFTQACSCLTKVLKNNIKSAVISTEYGDLHFYPIYCYSKEESSLVVVCCSEIGKVYFKYQWTEDGVLTSGGLYYHKYRCTEQGEYTSESLSTSCYQQPDSLFYYELIDTYTKIVSVSYVGDDDDGDGDGEPEEISLIPLFLIIIFAVIGALIVIATQKRKSSELQALEKKLNFVKNLDVMVSKQSTGYNIAYEIDKAKMLEEETPSKLLKEIFDLSKTYKEDVIPPNSPLANKIKESIKHIEDEIDWVNYKLEREKHKSS